MRVKVDWRTASRESYKDFCDKYPNIHLSFDQWKGIIYSFNESFRDYILETGEKAKFPSGFGEFSINKKRGKKSITKDGKEYIKLPVDWKKTREKGKKIYNFNFHTEGYIFGWMWFKETSRIRHNELWFCKPVRATSRLLSHYIKIDNKYQHMYKEWKV